MNRFVDRDMFMRFRGGGIGHKATWDWNDFLFSDAGKPVDDDGDDPESDEDRGGDREAAEDGLGAGDGAEAEDGVEDEDEDEDGDEDEDIKTWKHALQHPNTYDDDDDDSESDESEDESDEGDPDRVIPDEGEELDEDIYAREGYGAF